MLKHNQNMPVKVSKTWSVFVIFLNQLKIQNNAKSVSNHAKVKSSKAEGEVECGLWQWMIDNTWWS